VIELDTNGDTRLYGEVLFTALRMTRTKDASQAATQIDGLREATQRALTRYLRARPRE
jgi:hypothetical protein